MKSQRRGEIIFPNHNKINGCESAFSISQENDQKKSLIVKYNKNYIKQSNEIHSSSTKNKSKCTKPFTLHWNLTAALETKFHFYLLNKMSTLISEIHFMGITIQKFDFDLLSMSCLIYFFSFFHSLKVISDDKVIALLRFVYLFLSSASNSHGT